MGYLEAWAGIISTLKGNIVRGSANNSGDHMNCSRLLFILFALVLMSGCAAATSFSQVTTPEGKLGYTICCSGIGSGWRYCYQKAGEICGPEGYKILVRSNEQGQILDSAYLERYGVCSKSTFNREMLIQCNDNNFHSQP